jgi:hypothetical protein
MAALAQGPRRLLHFEIPTSAELAARRLHGRLNRV